LQQPNKKALRSLSPWTKTNPGALDLWKRETLPAAGADVLIINFCDAAGMVDAVYG
jgi:hypothetical protein